MNLLPFSTEELRELKHGGLEAEEGGGQEGSEGSKSVNFILRLCPSN
jgi:hypothetical protein